MLSMQDNPFITNLNGSGLQDEGCSGNQNPSDISTLPAIDDSLRASTSSTSTGASPDDTSTDSPGWNGGSNQSPPVDLDAPVNDFPRSYDFMLDPRARIAEMTDAMPKVEELDDGDIQDIKPPDVGNDQKNDNPSGAPAVVPRKRGRPRKHPLPAPNQAKVTKGRSKTGCITCRRRKKKCDETRPA